MAKRKIFHHYKDITHIRYDNSPSLPKLEISGKEYRQENILLNQYRQWQDMLETLGNFTHTQFDFIPPVSLTDEQLKQSSKRILQLFAIAFAIVIFVMIILRNT